MTLTAGEIREAMADPLSKIVEAVKRTLERTLQNLLQILLIGVSCLLEVEL